MMLQISLAARISLIVLIALLIVWLVALAHFFRTQASETSEIRPDPARIAAIVRLFETTPRDGQQALTVALSSASVSVYLSDNKDATGEPKASLKVAEATIEAYRAALGNHVFVVANRPMIQDFWSFPRGIATLPQALEFKITLISGAILVIQTRAPVLLTSLGLPVGFAAGFLGTLVALAALVIMHRETRPLARLVAALDRMDLGGEPALLPMANSSAPEIRALISAFNRLQSRLAGLLRARMAMLGGISHDVRSFATRLRLRVDHIPEQIERDRAIADIADMIQLLDDALLASRAGAGELMRELLEPSELVRAAVTDRGPAQDRITLLITSEAETACVLADRLALRRIIGNLLDNALNYAPRIWITLARRDGNVLLAVEDDGPGIPAHRRQDLLEPFVRLEASRNRQSGGAGLGLAVVRTLVEALGGSVAIGDAPMGGARIEVCLPVFLHHD